MNDYEIRKVETTKSKPKTKSEKFIVIELLEGRWGIFDTVKYKVVATCLDQEMAKEVCKEWNNMK